MLAEGLLRGGSRGGALVNEWSELSAACLIDVARVTIPRASIFYAKEACFDGESMKQGFPEDFAWRGAERGAESQGFRLSLLRRAIIFLHK